MKPHCKYSEQKVKVVLPWESNWLKIVGHMLPSFIVKQWQKIMGITMIHICNISLVIHFSKVAEKFDDILRNLGWKMSRSKSTNFVSIN